MIYEQTEESAKALGRDKENSKQQKSGVVPSYVTQE